MAASLSTIAGKDGNNAAIPNGIQALDLSGVGTGPWSFANIIVDGLSGVNRAAVKAASTAAVATDPALVIAPSPNSPFKLFDGANTATVKAASTAAVAGDTAVVVALSPNGQNTNGKKVAGSSAPVTLDSDTANVFGVTTTVAVPPPVTATSTYGSGNVVGGLMTFAATGRGPNNACSFVSATLTIKTAQTGPWKLYLFDSNPTGSTFNDKGAPVIAAADVNKQRAVITFTTPNSDLGAGSTLYKPDLTKSSIEPFSGTTIYGVLVAVGVPSAQFGSASDVTVTLGVRED